MKVKIPTQTREIVGDEIVKTKGEQEFYIDTSVASQMRYEANFPDLAKREDILGYSERICSIKNVSAAKILSELKLLYCWIETDLSFIDFVRLFDFSDPQYVKELTKVVTNAFDLIFNSSAEKN